MKVTIDLDGWSRREDVVAYADEYGMTVEQAIVTLVNSGLSHVWWFGNSR
jgi:hypothetical protein